MAGGNRSASAPSFGSGRPAEFLIELMAEPARNSTLSVRPRRSASIRNSAGRPDPKLGAEAMRQALELHRSENFTDVPVDRFPALLADLARSRNLRALGEALRQRYPEPA